jgi:uncharacterized protein (TIGR02996 family)
MTAPTWLSEEWLFRVAPDGKSAQAARALAAGGRFAEARRSPDGTYLQAECQGSERRPYAVAADLADRDHLEGRCNCMSMKAPCKHALGLAFLLLRDPSAFEEMPLPKAVEKARQERTPQTPPAEAEPARPDPATLRAEFLRSIREEPADDARRLIFADWLDEHGDAADAARAAFIRVQIALSRPSAGDDAQRLALEKQEARLWKAHRKAWLADVPVILRRQGILFQRGFLDGVWTAPRHFLRHAAALFERHPVFRVRLTSYPSPQEASRLAACPQLERVRHLDLSRTRLESGPLLRVLLNTPFLRRLESLDLSVNDLSPDAVRVVAGCERLAGLRSLLMAWCTVGEAGALRLAASPHLAGLTLLDLRGTGLAERKAAATALRARFGDRVML